VIAVLNLLACCAVVYFRGPSLRQRLALVAIAILVTILCGTQIHGNYRLWWLPFAAAFLAPFLVGGSAPAARSETADL
jgi:hypothetical protein